MGILQAIFLGVIQGATEILPISSSGHLVIAPWLFNFKDPGLSFDIALHLGTLLAILVFFYKDIQKVLMGGLNMLLERRVGESYEKLFLYILIATIPGVLAGAFLESKAETLFRSPLLVAFSLFAFAFVIFYADRFAKNPKPLEKMDLKDSIFIGLSQALAIIPGVSRSGVTISAGLLRKLNRADAARFSFLLAVPIILGAALYNLLKIDVSTLFSTYFIAGFLASAVSGFLAIKFLDSFLKTKNFNLFVYYRVFLAAGIVIIYFYLR